MSPRILHACGTGGLALAPANLRSGSPGDVLSHRPAGAAGLLRLAREMTPLLLLCTYTVPRVGGTAYVRVYRSTLGTHREAAGSGGGVPPLRACWPFRRQIGRRVAGWRRCTVHAHAVSSAGRSGEQGDRPTYPTSSSYVLTVRPGVDRSARHLAIIQPKRPGMMRGAKGSVVSTLIKVVWCGIN